MQCRAVIEQPVAVVAGFDDMMNAEEAAHRLDVIEARLPQAGDDESQRGQREEARRTVALEQHDSGEDNERDLERQFRRRRQPNAER